jgi:hypothetical protein
VCCAKSILLKRSWTIADGTNKEKRKKENADTKVSYEFGLGRAGLGCFATLEHDMHQNKNSNQNIRITSHHCLSSHYKMDFFLGRRGQSP